MLSPPLVGLPVDLAEFEILTVPIDYFACFEAAAWRTQEGKLRELKHRDYRLVRWTLQGQGIRCSEEVGYWEEAKEPVV